MEETNPLPQAAEEAVIQLDAVLCNLRRVLVGIALAYASTQQEKARVLLGAAGVEEACLPNPLPFRAGGSLLVLSALFFFTKQSQQRLEAAQEPSDQCSAQIDYTGNLLVLSVALARLADLLRTSCTPPAPLQQQEAETSTAI